MLTTAATLWHYITVPTEKIIMGEYNNTLSNEVYEWAKNYNLTFHVMAAALSTADLGLICLNGIDGNSCFWFRDRNIAFLFKMVWG